MMGTSMSVYIGPYLYLEGIKKKEVSVDLICRKCKKIRSGIYCLCCGTELEVNATMRHMSDFDIFRDKFEDTFYSPSCIDGNDDNDKNKMILLANKYNWGQIYDSAMNITQRHLVESLHLFNKKAADAIEHAKKYADIVEVKFGVITYWS